LAINRQKGLKKIEIPKDLFTKLNNHCFRLNSLYYSSGSGHARSSGKCDTPDDMTFTQFFFEKLGHVFQNTRNIQT